MTTIANQVYIFLYAIAGGAIAAFLYDIIRIKRRAIRTGIIIVNLEDLLYWFTAAILMFLVVYNSNNGEIRGYFFIGNIIGVMLYLSLLSHLIIASSVAMINLIKRIFKFLWKVISYPFILLYKVVVIPVEFIFKLILRLVRFIIRPVGKAAKKAVCFTGAKIKGINLRQKILGKIRKKS